MAQPASLAYPTFPQYTDLSVIPSPVRKVMRFLHDYNAQGSWPRKESLDNLIKKRLRRPIDILVEPDGSDYLAYCPELPLYGFGASVDEAIEMLKREIESIYDDLSGNDSFTEDWYTVKAFLEERIA